MNKTILKTLSMSICLITFWIAADNKFDCRSIPYFSYRSQSYSAARELMLWANDYHINLFDMCDYYGSFALTLEGTKSFRSHELAQCLFGNGLSTPECGNATIAIQGSQVPDRGHRAWLADYFGLPVDYVSTITLAPQISNILLDFNWYMGLDPWTEGMYFRIHAPLVYTRWDLNACESVVVPGSNGYQAGYFSTNPLARSVLNSTAISFLGGNGAIPEAHLAGLEYAKWNSCTNQKTKPATETKLSDVVMALGWNFFQCEDYHLGLNLRGSAPAGNRPDGRFFFQPIVGNGHHGGLGVGLTSHVILWRDCECERYFGFYFDANLLHLFRTNQVRIFDLKGKPNSRYALAALLETPVEDGLRGNSEAFNATATIPPTNVSPTNGYTNSLAQFKNQFTSVANLTRSKVNVSASIQGYGALLFDYTACNWSIDVGYEFYARSCEDIDKDCECSTLFTQNTWGLKGDAHMYGFPIANWAAPNFNFDAITTTDGIALAPSQSNSSIFAGTNRTCIDTLNANVQDRNPGIDNAKFAFSDPSSTLFPGVFNPLFSNPITIPVSIRQILPNAFQTRTSIDPRFISQQDFDIQGSQTKYISNKVFLNIGYTWADCECWVPYFGIGGKAEFGQTDDNCCNADCTTSLNCATNCDECKSCAVSEWGVWAKGGVSFH